MQVLLSSEEASDFKLKLNTSSCRHPNQQTGTEGTKTTDVAATTALLYSAGDTVLYLLIDTTLQIKTYIGRHPNNVTSKKGYRQEQYSQNKVQFNRTMSSKNHVFLLCMGNSENCVFVRITASF